MMKNLVLVLVAISFVATSCKKDDDTSTPNHLKGLVKKYIYDDGETITFEYDEQKKLIKETSTYPNDPAITINYEYYQNGKIAKANYSEDNELYSIDKYEWVNNKLTLTPIRKNDVGEWINNSPQVFFFDENEKLIKEEQYIDRGAGDILSYYTEYTWQNGNITNATEYNPSGEVTGTITYEYGNTINISPYANVQFYPVVISSANLTKYVSIKSGNVSEVRYSYVYSEGSNNPESVTRTVFFNDVQSEVSYYDCEYY